MPGLRFRRKQWLPLVVDLRGEKMGWLEKETKGKIAYKYGEEIQPYSKKKSPFLCPECGELVKSICICEVADSACVNGHKWHIESVKGKRIVKKGKGVH